MGLTVVDVYADSPHEGDIFVDGSIRLLKGVRYSVAAGLLQINEWKLGQVVFSNTSPTPLVLPKDFLIARDRIAREEFSLQVLTISTTVNNVSESITDSIGTTLP